MIRRDDLIESIAECEGVRNPNAHTCIMLAAFYIILDHMDGKNTPVEYSFAPAPQEEVTFNSGTEFSDAVQGKDINQLFEIMDELMSTLQVLHPRLYAGVMRRINE